MQWGSEGWLISLAIGLVAGYALHAAGVDGEGWRLGIALATTALGTLVPILSDSGLLPIELGAAVLGTGVAGKFWPIVVISVFLTGVYGAATEVILLFAFGGVLLARAVGFDYVLGAFAAGLVVGLALDSPEGRNVHTRLDVAIVSIGTKRGATSDTGRRSSAPG